MFERTRTVKRIVSVSAAAMCILSSLRIAPETEFTAFAVTNMSAFEITEDMYGDYEIPEKMNASGEEGFLTFEKEGVSYMTVVATHSYTYDEESGEIRLDEDEAGDKDTVKVDGDTLTFTDSFGNEQVFERAD